MDFLVLSARAAQIRLRYARWEQERYGRSWTEEEIALGLVGDVGDLMKLVQGKAGVRPHPDLDEALAHELADCLWAVMTLASTYEVDLEAAFLRTMDQLEQSIADPTDTVAAARQPHRRRRQGAGLIRTDLETNGGEPSHPRRVADPVTCDTAGDRVYSLRGRGPPGCGMSGRGRTTCRRPTPRADPARPERDRLVPARLSSWQRCTHRARRQHP
ncbi:hypothetical protein J1G44_17535 [Cellulomonas sp. zg-ZUI199]|uniref:NTP pyrophosphohydrolase MazG-like domain-containing protein n=1 Tax=Cellulomonas wangleii TaxID=2816956 RepID=A0ABX8D5Q9_9CELL|nr:hypothetical protein [Cellulomonas wangleii]QVI62784.1 hypothetical protein KG103_02250 [Cellulomonas wangleii]